MAREKSYTVLVPRALSGAEAEDKTLFLREGFSFFAFLIPFLYALWHRHWLLALVLLLADGLLTAALAGLPLHEAAVSGVSFVLHLLFGAEAVNLRRALLTRKRYDERAVVRAGSSEEAELRYFASGDGIAAPASASVVLRGEASSHARASGPGIFGLFPSADTRPRGLG
jgi:hypothetical protein